MKKKINFGKIFVYLLLAMLVIGFTFPSFLDDPQPLNQIKPCRSDADCYLMCDEVPRAALCYQNLCQQSSCQEEALFPYQNAPLLQAQLDITINQKPLHLQKQFETIALNNFFVQFQEDSFTTFAPQLTLNHILDKLQISLDSQCLTVEEENYCQIGDHQLKIFINGEQQYNYLNHEISNNDHIKITYQ